MNSWCRGLKKIIRCPTIAGDGDIVTVDADGEEIYLDIAIDGESFSAAIDGLITKAIETARATLAKAGLTAGDISKIIFIGRPVNYKRIRERVVAELSIPGDIEVNPMTAVSEGAAVALKATEQLSRCNVRKISAHQPRRNKSTYCRRLGAGARRLHV